MFQATQQPQTIPQPQQTRSAHAISNPTLAGIEKRWEAMPPQEQAELWMQLRDRMKVDWTEMTLQEKKAGALRPTHYLTMAYLLRALMALLYARPSLHELQLIIWNYSLVDCIWPSWPQSRRSARGVDQGYMVHDHRSRYFRSALLRHQLLRSTTATYNDKGVARGYQRVLEGM
jgi:hypothetical protein